MFAPTRGVLAQLGYARAVRGLLSEFAYGTWRLDGRGYRAIGAGHTLAAQVLVTAVDGGAPFDQLALAGGSDMLRGYVRGRYRDRALAALQTEYRSPMRRRLNGVLFAGVGTLASSVHRLGSGRLLPTLGVGVRLELDPQQRTSVRADYGRGIDGASGLYLGFNQAF